MHLPGKHVAIAALAVAVALSPARAQGVRDELRTPPILRAAGVTNGSRHADALSDAERLRQAVDTAKSPSGTRSSWNPVVYAIGGAALGAVIGALYANSQGGSCALSPGNAACEAVHGASPTKYATIGGLIGAGAGFAVGLFMNR